MKQLLGMILFGIAACSTNGDNKNVDGESDNGGFDTLVGSAEQETGSDLYEGDGETDDMIHNIEVETEAAPDAGIDTETGTTDTAQSGDTEHHLTCPDGRVLYTTVGGTSFCCGGNYPVFCDETGSGYPGGCWGTGASCDTLIYCKNKWGVCPEGTASDCLTDLGVVCYPD